MENGTSSIRIWESAGQKIPYVPYTYKHVFAFEERYWNPHLVHQFIVDYWHLSLLIVIAYVVLIHAIQAFMKPLKPFQLKLSLITWNLSLALFSIAGTLRSGEEFFHIILTRRSLHDSICITYDPAGIASLWNFLFIVSKVAELIDTLFIVFRKKPLIFLHWYHHAAVLIVSWHGARTIIAPSRIFIFLNYLVHSFMYTYYAITATGRRLSRSIAMFVTTIQNLQMLAGVSVVTYAAKVRWIDKEFCHMSDQDLTLCFFVYLTFAILFTKFFINAYMRKVEKPKMNGKVNGSANGVANGSTTKLMNGHEEKKLN